MLADEELVRIESEESSDSDSGYSGESSTELEDEEGDCEFVAN